ncbi:HpsJ family protein [Aetokthonos hydrillicola Thurmond2011]|jgi:hypothetical protein|uniref:HpsJ family protein n=1 Tax=Aetokthonos hydrillicola Thurmond2011 TaxID=2712845 RepID=A0AAP5ICY6_9CYAN|nr:HpsJ family protein [Aetokthonos hydrillicola]MBO3458904.1 hypothetical protein [Aetokthonos hydrillicola CCALA 1050]MBW4587247.1 HpsJ family protein [Aetokthonos hydrillicola CCALA 1050]MDR9896730.1 HpsJ family protein [Aetokthonos hydrillicola Thurmond2011]
MTKSQIYDWDANSLFRFGGYILLILALIDFINILIPFHFTNPVWEFQMIGALVDHATVPLIGLIFVFAGHRKFSNRLEFYLLKFLSWSALFVGVLFLLLLPLGINNTWRIDHQNNFQILNHSSQKIAQLHQIKKLLNNAKTDQELNNIFHSFNSEQTLPKLANPQNVKTQIVAQIAQIEKNVNNQTKAIQNDKHQELIRNSVKWNLGALICAVAFIWIWRATNSM